MISNLLQRFEQVQDLAALLGVLAPDMVAVPDEKEKKELGFRVSTPEPRVE